MRIFVLIVIGLLGLLAPRDAAAGAWPREKGAWFLSGAVHLSWPQDTATWTSRTPTGRYDAFYAEYGLTDRLTLGVDVGRSVSGATKTIGFLRLPLVAPEARIRIAAEIGLGRIDGLAVARPGLSLGYGWDGGWLSADGLWEQPVTGAPADMKLDLTWGVDIGSGRKFLLQVQTGQQAGDPAFARLAPSVVVPLRGPVSAELGVSYGLVGDASMGLKLGVWSSF